MSPLEYFRLLAPEFASIDDAVAEVWITMAGNLIAVDALGPTREAMAQALYGAHLLRLTQTQAQAGAGALGAVTREKEGDLERQYGAVKGSDTWLGQTTYGQQYLEITRLQGLSIMTRVSVPGY